MRPDISPDGGRVPSNDGLGVSLAALTEAEYLDAVADFWAQAPDACDRCCLYHGPGYCAMLHDREIPDADCLGLRERDGFRRPWRVTPNAEAVQPAEGGSDTSALLGGEPD